MTISQYTIQQITPFITGDEHPPRRTGPQLVKFFNKFGARDIYDEFGLPDIGNKNGHRPSRKEYVEARLGEFSNRAELRELISQVVNELEHKESDIVELNSILNPEKYGIVLNGDSFIVQGGVVDRRKPVVNEAHFQEIQSKILAALESTRVSVRVVMAWFTNETLFDKLLEKHNSGIDVQVAIYDDGVNRKHGVDVTKLPHVMIKRGKHGGLMHDKFCVIDNQVVITGSYNWTNNAEFRNDENITIERDPEQATRFSEEFMRLAK